MRPMTVDELADEWSGFTEDGIYFSLDLTKSGRGTCSYVYYQGQSRLLTVETWKPNGHEISVRLGPIDENVDGIHEMRGHVSWLTMDLVVSGGSWSRKVLLRREADRSRRAALVRERIERHLREGARSSKSP